ncbi:hypothetical protein P154DRAFT_419677 [Amniculicola lignicola CBS 123094]|uniref:Uncharacterized protein n=1 Tax=Amniculicola lignicola CBS 123094 TaxID=1392246 RepID=A0A6A5X442_9PLEO|nr:hypothetical protein P154DRAFT_419677 [Amniculicola lignicola CBS 123094]
MRTATHALRSARIASLHTSPTIYLRGSRNISTLPGNPHIYVVDHPSIPNRSLLTLLSTEPPTASLAIGTTSHLPPTPDSFTPNPQFLSILQSVLHAYAAHDPSIHQQAAVYSSTGGMNLGTSASGGSHGAGAGSIQGGMGGGNRGGWVHLSDERNPPDWGRIAWPEDIFGSVEVDGRGVVVEGSFQDSGTYRMVTREGILGLSPFLRGKVVERLEELEGEMREGN